MLSRRSNRRSSATPSAPPSLRPALEMSTSAAAQHRRGIRHTVIQKLSALVQESRGRSRLRVRFLHTTSGDWCLDSARCLCRRRHDLLATRLVRPMEPWSRSENRVGGIKVVPDTKSRVMIGARLERPRTTAGYQSLLRGVISCVSKTGTFGVV